MVAIVNAGQEVSLETLYQAVNRFWALVEQYDMIDQSQAQIEMQSEILLRIPSQKRKPEVVKQVQDQLASSEVHKDAIHRAIRDVTGKDIGELRQRVTDLKLALTRFSEIELEYSKTKQAFEILAASNGFDIDPGEGGSRLEFERELGNLKQSKEFVVKYLRDAVLSCLNTEALTKPQDSVLSSLIRQKANQ